jgi:hypothetical protein
MLATLVAAAVIACPTSEDLTAIEAPAAALQLVVRIEEGHFLAFNPTPLPELIEFTCDARGTRAVVVISAYEDVDFTFEPGAIDGVQMEVFADDLGTVEHSGRWSLEKLRDNAGNGAWIENSCGHAHTWASKDTAWYALESLGDDNSGSAHSLCMPPAIPPPPAPHVPVITPDDSQYGDLPPRLESKPLPPV